MLAVLLLRLFRKQHEKYPWEVSMTEGGGLCCDLDDMQLWQEEVEQARNLLKPLCPSVSSLLIPFSPYLYVKTERGLFHTIFDRDNMFPSLTR